MTLLSPALLRRLDVLARSLRFGTAPGQSGMEISRARGGNQEFLDRTPYAHGDDPRTIDWLAYARSTQPTVKRFAIEEGAHVSLLLDCSLSMSLGSPSKFDVLRELAAALGYLALVGGARVQVVHGNDDARTLVHAQARRGRSSALALFDDIARCTTGARTPLRGWLAQLERARIRGAVVVVSDFLDETNAVPSLERLAAHGRASSLVQVLAPEEVHPEFHGSYTLVSVEDEQQLQLTLDPGALLRYERNLHQRLAELSSWARSKGRTYVRHLCGRDPWPTIQRFARGAVDPP